MGTFRLFPWVGSDGVPRTEGENVRIDPGHPHDEEESARIILWISWEFGLEWVRN